MECLAVKKETVVERIRRMFFSLPYMIRAVVAEFGLNLIRWSEKDSNYIKHAEREFTVIGWPGDCEMQTEICKDLKDLLYVFGTQGHSGTSAPYTIERFKRLASFEVLSPLTGEDGEWNEVGDGLFQNNRCSRVFKDINEDGRAYDIEGRIFREPDGECYTSQDSRVYLDFPCIPKSEYIDVSE